MSILSLPGSLQSWRNNPEVTGISRNDQLQAAAEQFEAMFLQQILKQMRKAGDVLSEDSLMRSRELDTMRERMRQVRARLAAAGKAGNVDLSPTGSQNGLFSIIPLSSEQVLAMREKHGVYMAGSGRINVAGLTMGNIDKFIAAVADVTA